MKNMFKYYLSNKRRGISLIFVMALTVFSIYFVTSLVQSIFSTVEYSNIACLNDFSFVYPVGGSSFLSDETVEKIQKDDSVKKAYPILLEYTVIKIHDMPQKISSTSSRTDIIHFPLFHLLQLFRL